MSFNTIEYSQSEEPPNKRVKLDNRKGKNQAERRSSIHQPNHSAIYEESTFTSELEVQGVGYSCSVKVVNKNQLHNVEAPPDVISTILRPPPPNANYSIRKRFPQQIFSNQQEKELSEFVRDASDYYNGLTSKDVRILAFVYGVCNKVDLPAGWQDNHQASFAWCSRFAKRHKLSLLFAGNGN